MKIRLRGKRHWTGRQWAVTNYGLEALDGTYSIKGKELWHQTGEHGWVEQMRDKNWCDLADFKTGLAKARLRFANATFG